MDTRKLEIESEIVYNQLDLTHMMAERAGFTKEDAQLLYYAFRDIIAEIVQKEAGLSLPKLFSLRVKTKKSWVVDNSLFGHQEFPSCKFVNIKTGRYLTDIANHRIPYEDDENEE